MFYYYYIFFINATLTNSINIQVYINTSIHTSSINNISKQGEIMIPNTLREEI